MKDLLKTLLLIIVGLTAVIAVYPSLHEAGHTLATLITGSNVIDVQIWPLPSTLCKIDTGNLLQIIVIGFGGIIFPFLVTLSKPPKRFLTWYLWFATKMICILSYGISLCAIAFYKTKLEIVTDDLTRVMEYAPEYRLIYISILVMLIMISAAQAVKSRPIKRCMQYFEI